ncbi:MAG: respiratory nitrate reductase subunit gamma [Sphingosinicella sp.]|uniref:respiratory nitrate reductase subunit gamma n=1 Tax=Sphingosinicella sp. TaxID=1917971 RepID=UPI0040383878
MQSYVHHLLFGIYPYVALAIFFIGSLLRFETDQYGWRSKSSQFLRRRQLVWGSILFHLGILGLLAGHAVGLLTPIAIFDAIGIGHGFKQMTAIVAGGLFGTVCFVGLTMLLHRRLFDPRIRKTSSASDIAVLVILWTQLVLGMLTIPFSLAHPDGEEMVRFMSWAQGIVTFQSGAAAHIEGVPIVFLLHIFLGLTILVVFPFTRLVHVWSAPIGYVVRRYQVVRTRRRSEVDPADVLPPVYAARTIALPSPPPPVRRAA